MRQFLKLAGALLAATLLATTPIKAQTTVYSAGDSTSGTYMDYMKTVYARAGNPEIIQLPLTSFDNDYVLNPMAAESWMQSEDGLTWTFKLRPGLVWSDGEPLRADNRRRVLGLRLGDDEIDARPARIVHRSIRIDELVA